MDAVRAYVLLDLRFLEICTEMYVCIIIFLEKVSLSYGKLFGRGLNEVRYTFFPQPSLQTLQVCIGTIN